MLSLPDESAGTIRAQFRSKSLTPSARQSAAASTGQEQDPLKLIRRSALEVLTALRDLEEHARLPLSDDAYDAQSEGGGSTRGGDKAAFTASPSVGGNAPLPDEDLVGVEVEEEDEGFADTSLAFSLVQVPGRWESVPVWEDEESAAAALFEEEEDALKEKREHWDERLVLGGGWLYRPDVSVSELEKEKGVVGRYLNVVDEVLFGGKTGGEERGWERERKRMLGSGSGARNKAKRRVSAPDGDSRRAGMFLSPPGGNGGRRVSTGMMGDGNLLSVAMMSEEPLEMGMGQIAEEEEAVDDGEESVDDEDLPEWARREVFLDDKLGMFPLHFSLVPFTKRALLRQRAPTPSFRPSSRPRSCPHSRPPRTRVRPSSPASPRVSCSASRIMPVYASPKNRGGTSAGTGYTISSPWKTRRRNWAGIRPRARRRAGRLGGQIICGFGLGK